MNILHTGDWHLGKTLEGFSRLEAARQEADKGEELQLTEDILNKYGIEGLDPDYMDMLEIVIK